MRTQRSIRLILGSVASLVLAAVLMGSSCESDIQDQFVKAGLDFVKSEAGDVLKLLFPIAEQLK